MHKISCNFEDIMTRNILFDLGNVLIDVDIRRTLRAYKTLIPSLSLIGQGGRNGGQADRLIGKSNTIITVGDLLGAGESDLVAKYQVGAISTDEFLNTILPACKLGTTRQDLINAWMAMLIGIPEARKQKLLDLHKQGYKLYVLSNINELHAEWTREQLKGIPFEAMFFSNEIQMAKPDARCYEHVIRETGIVPEETLYIDDLPENIAAGQRARFQCFLNTTPDAWTEMLKNYKITH